MKIALVHTEFRQTHLEKVMSEMMDLGAPRIRAVWLEDRGFWAALEGCHRLRAAAVLEIEPEIVAVKCEPGMTWADVGMGHDYIAGAISLEKVIERAGQEYVIGFGDDRLPLPHEVRRPEPGEVMRYRVIAPIHFDADSIGAVTDGGGGVVGGAVGSEFETEKDLVDYVTQGFLEVVGARPKPEVKRTKEQAKAPVRKAGK